CKPEEANEVLQFENLRAPDGRLPLNTSGGNLAECYMHGLELQVEAVRQIQGRAGERQLSCADTMFVSGNGGIISEQTALVLQGG
ncbi:MAG: hypothetical protein KC481_19790, partial [Acidimicrobiaceae bacterium]|nr:hypothetical protein [Acidimicrobiaceae bacterium]